MYIRDVVADDQNRLMSDLTGGLVTFCSDQRDALVRQGQGTSR